MKINSILILLFLCAFSQAQNTNSLIRKGNNAYADSTYVEAENIYREALQKNQNSFTPSFNLADATYKQEKYSDASIQFEASLKKATNKKDKAKSYHNLGNSLFNEDKLEESIQAYKNALKSNPDDMDTKYNLAFAQRLKKQNEQNQEQDKKEEEQEEEKEQEKKEEQEKEQEKKEEQEQNSDSKEDKKEEPKEPKDPNEMTEEEAKQMLDALQQQEKELQQDLQKKKGKASKIKIEKDW